MSQRKRVKLICTEPTRTKQAFKDEVNVNNIVAKYHKTGLLPTMAKPGRYGDFTKVTDYQGAMNKMIEVQNMFGALPAKVRDRFRNDVGSFLSFVDDEKNVKEMVEMGLIAEPTPSQPTAQPAASEKPAAQPQTK